MRKHLLRQGLVSLLVGGLVGGALVGCGFPLGPSGDGGSTSVGAGEGTASGMSGTGGSSSRSSSRASSSSHGSSSSGHLSTTGSGRVECTSAFDCGTPDEKPCESAACEGGKCVIDKAPQGSLPSFDDGTEVPDCQRLVCDGNGGQVVENDSTNVPVDQMGDCSRPTCSDGVVVVVPDPADVPANQTGDCRTPTCTADGQVSFDPDPSDVPPDSQAGDCYAPSCDAVGNVTRVAANDPPTSLCLAYTCSDGTPVGTPQNQQMSCSNHGFICGADGMCDTCPAATPSCADPGPGAGANTLATAHDLGDIGFCDYNGFSICETLTAGQTAFFHYISDGSGSFCDFDPYVHVQASASVKACEYFDCPSVQCPLPSLPDTLSGMPGCCLSGATLEMAISPSCSDSQAYITVKSGAGACTSYELTFHT